MSSNKQPGLPTEVSYNEAVEASKNISTETTWPLRFG